MNSSFIFRSVVVLASSAHVPAVSIPEGPPLSVGAIVALVTSCAVERTRVVRCVSATTLAGDLQLSKVITY
jgi:hypothetical protein